MEITHYSDFYAVHDSDWGIGKGEPWIFIRKERSMKPLPIPSVQIPLNSQENTQRVLPHNWIFVTCT